MSRLHCMAAGVLLAVTALACVAGSAAAQAVGAATSPVSQAYDLEADVTRVMTAFDVPGVAIAIVKDGKLVTARGFGVRRRGEAGAVDADTIFEIASNSKGFTAAALALLVDQGKLAWDDPVTRHLPEFRMYDAYVTQEMTVRDLLVHRSGLGLGAGDLLWWPTTTFSTDEIIHQLRHIRPATSFRNSYAYDNLLYIVAGKIIAQKAGKPWGEVLRERFFQPLGMTRTSTSIDQQALLGNWSSPHSKINDKAVPVKPIPVPNAVGAVGVNSSANDLARWMNALLAGPGIVSPEQARELWTAQTPMKISTPKPTLEATRPNFLAYGLGFQLRDYQGRKLVQHGGALQGFYTYVVMVPEESLGIAILTNAESSPALRALQYRLLDQHLGVAPTDWIGRIAAVQRAEDDKERQRIKSATTVRSVKSTPSLALAAYDGQYQDAWYGKMSIGVEGGKRVLRFARTPDLVGELQHFQHDTFIVRWKERNFNADAYVTFSLNPDGSIERVKMAPVSEETDFSYDFADLLFTPLR